MAGVETYTNLWNKNAYGKLEEQNSSLTKMPIPGKPTGIQTNRETLNLPQIKRNLRSIEVNHDHRTADRRNFQTLN